MSFLLDALRKTENRKHLREVPTIFSPGPAAGISGGRRRYGPVVLLLLPAFLVLLWFGSRQYVGPGDPAGNPAPATPGGTPPAQQQPAAGQSEGARAALEPPPAPQRSDSGGQEASPEPSVATARTPVATLDIPPEAAPPASDRREEVGGELAGRGSTEPALPEPLDAIPLESAPAADPEPAREPEPGTFRPGEPGVITYWQLPEAIRGELPGLRISVLVYSERPEDRFLLVNGRRLVEGDTLSPGLVTEEIRRDGVVFSYRRYRFLVSR